MCEIPRNSDRIRSYSSSRSSKVTSYYYWLIGSRICTFDWHQGLWPWQGCDFLLVISIVTSDVSPTVFEILTHKARKWPVFPPSLVVWRPHSGRTRHNFYLKLNPVFLNPVHSGEEYFVVTKYHQLFVVTNVFVKFIFLIYMYFVCKKK